MVLSAVGCVGLLNRLRATPYTLGNFLLLKTFDMLVGNHGVHGHVSYRRTPPEQVQSLAVSRVGELADVLTGA